MSKIWLAFACYALCIYTHAHSFAQSCDALVVDESGVLQGRTQEIEAAARDLQSIGAEVRVRTYTTIGASGTLDTFVKQLESQCPSWQSPTGRKSNLLVFVHSKQERAAGIFSGITWKEPVDNNYARILADHMRPHFRQNDYAGAFTAGISETHRVLYTHLHPGETTTHTTIHAEGISTAMLSISLLIAFLCVVYGGMQAYRYVTARTEVKQNSRTQAILSKQRATQRLTALEARLSRLHGQPLQQRPVARRKHAQAKQMLDAAWLLYDQYEPGNTSIQLSDSRLTTADYTGLGAVYGEVNAKLDIVEQLAQEVEKILPG